MANVHEPALDLALESNSVAAIRTRVLAGRVTWTGPLVMAAARLVLFLAAQGAVALLFLAQHRASAWHQATLWWSVCFTGSDVVCLIGLHYFTRREGIRIRDLLGPIHMRRGHDIWLGLGFYLLVFPFFMAGGYLSQLVFYGSRLNPGNYILHAHALPVWAVVYSFAVWWIVNSATEDTTYQGYVLPRLEALTGRTWAAVAIVCFFFTLQHCAIGFLLDWRSILSRFCAFLPGCLAVTLIYVRTRRLAPLIFAHWPMDFGAVFMTTF
ncbi:MAG TPA: CPBP family intramembrane glutamic endopeptidase [Terracidiphilus sp.]|nr:CPBP family intramembrane glutamic endopeptidase [Terracidiphilus sp.]